MDLEQRKFILFMAFTKSVITPAQFTIALGKLSVLPKDYFIKLRGLSCD